MCIRDRLTRTGRPHDRDELAGLDVEVDTREGVYLDLLADAVCLRDTAQAHHRPRRGGRRAVSIWSRRAVRHLIARRGTLRTIWRRTRITVAEQFLARLLAVFGKSVVTPLTYAV